MTVKKRFFSRKVWAAGLLSVGGLLFAYALLFGAADSPIPGWVSVNEPLREALEPLQSASPHSRPSASSPEPKVASEPQAEQSALASQPPTENSPTESTPLNDKSQPETRSALIDLNSATQEELDTLPGIGPSKAKAIIAYREENNGFRSVEQLLEVKGIGEKMLERVIALVRVSQTE